MSSDTATIFWSATYSQCCAALLEPDGLQLGLMTEDEFYALAKEVLIDFFAKTGLVKKVFNARMMVGVPAYPEPDQMGDIETVLANQTYLHRTSGYSLDNSDPAWPSQFEAPAMFREDQIPVSQIQLIPSPNVGGNDVALTNVGWGVMSSVTAGEFAVFTGAAGFGVPCAFTGNPYVETTDPGFGVISDMTPSAGNITMIAASAPDSLASIAELPASFRIYLKYGILAQVFTTNSELKDMQKAAYCQARYAEGINLAAALMAEDHTESVPQ